MFASSRSRKQTSIKRISKGHYGVRYASQSDHLKNGWIYTNCISVRAAVDAADMFLAERGMLCVALLVVDHRGSECEFVSREE